MNVALLPQKLYMMEMMTMGCDIHIWYQKQNENGEWEDVDVSPRKSIFGYDLCPLDYRSYSLFGFLANVRNYSEIPPICEPRGWPDDVKEYLARYVEDWDYHSHSWLTIKELMEFDYDKTFVDKEYEYDDVVIISYRKFLGEGYFENLKILMKNGVERIVFCFDN